MEEILGRVFGEYLNVTLACVIFGYLITTTPYLQKVSAFVPIIVTVVGALLGVILYGATVDVVVYGALAGILSTGLYELFGKGIKNIGKTLEKRGGISNTEDDK